MSVREQLAASIAALEAQRSTLSDPVVDAAIAPLKARLRELESAASDPAQEIKQVTILFADIVGSTALGQKLDAEDLHAVLEGALAGFGDVVREHRGRVMTYTGDGLMAAFGVPDSHEDDPENAIRAGLVLLSHTSAYADNITRSYGVSEFNIRVGVHTGFVLLGGDEGTTTSIRGDAVNVAARLEQSAPAGGLRISHDTYRHVRGVFDIIQEPPLQLKGLTAPIQTYLVQRAKPRAFRVVSRGVEGVETPMVGREAEFTRLRRAFLAMHEGAAAEDCTRSVIVIADAGIGKSRLLYEFENWAEGRPERFVLFKGRAQPVTQNQPFGLLRDVFAWRLQIADNDPAELARAKLASQLASLFPGDGAAEVHLLGHLIGLDFSKSEHVRPIESDPRQIKERGLNAAATALRRWGLAQGAPAVVLLDDLHWADDGSLEFFQRLLETDRAAPLLLIGFARPVLGERCPSWPRCGPTDERIELAPLNEASRADLADVLLQRLEAAPDALKRLLATGGDGNPFFMEELVKMLIDDGAISVQSHSWRVTPEKLLSTKVPGTLTGVLQARLDGLPSDERAALQAASVLGFVFWNNALTALDPAAAAALPSLAKRELVIRQAASAIEGAQEYTFKHHVLHQVVYDGLLKKRKRQLHARAATWFSALSQERGGEYSATTAAHYERAGDNKSAVDSYIMAIETAAARDANAAVVDYATCALDLCDETNLHARWRLTVAREHARAYSDDRPGHNADLVQLTALADAMDDDVLRAEALIRHASAYNNIGDFTEAMAAAKQARALAQKAGDQSIVIRAFSMEAIACRRMAQYEHARDLAERGLALAREGFGLALQADLCRSLSAICAESGDPAEDQQYRREALELFRRLGDRGNESHMLNSVGDGLVRVGDYVNALRSFEEALQIARRIGRRDTEALVLLNMAAIAVLRGDNANAAILGEDAHRIAASAGARDLEAAACLPLGLARLAEGDIAGARRSLQRSRDLFLQNAGPHYALEPMVALAMAAAAEGEFEESIVHLQPALEHLAAGGSFQGAEEPLRMRWMCHKVLAAAGDPRAERVLADAYSELQRRAGQLTDSGMRQRYVENVPHHAAIVAAWRKRS